MRTSIYRRAPLYRIQSLQRLSWFITEAEVYTLRRGPMVERSPEKAGVGGSSPSLATTF